MAHKATILCIEDEQDIIDLIRMLLQPRGFEVAGALGGQDGMDYLIHQPTPDLVLLDLMMHDMDGWQVYDWMKKQDNLQDVPVIVVTARSRALDKTMGLQVAKVDDYVTKPFGPMELISSIERVLIDRDVLF